MIKKTMNILIVFVIVLLLFGCSEGKKETNVVKYKTGFPEKYSRALVEFLLYYSTPRYSNLIGNEKDKYVYSYFNTINNPEEIEYYSFTDEQLKKYFEPMFETNNPLNIFRNLTSEFETEMFNNKVNGLNFDYPKAILEEDNMLTLHTAKGEKTFDLVELLHHFDLKYTDDLILRSQFANEDSFVINVNNTDADTHKYINVFIKQDFSDLTAVSGSTAEYRDNVLSGELSDYKELVYETDLNDQYILLNDNYGVLDKNDNRIYSVSEPDYLSIDGKFIYLNGTESPLSDGVQRIQKIEDYLEGNDHYYAEFEISFERISKELDLGSTGNVSTGKIVYFNEDYIVLFLNFTAPFFGTAGSTNVIIDLQEDKNNPTFYLVDLGLN